MTSRVGRAVVALITAVLLAFGMAFGTVPAASAAPEFGFTLWKRALPDSSVQVWLTRAGGERSLLLTARQSASWKVSPDKRFALITAVDDIEVFGSINYYVVNTVDGTVRHVDTVQFSGNAASFSGDSRLVFFRWVEVAQVGSDEFPRAFRPRIASFNLATGNYWAPVPLVVDAKLTLEPSSFTATDPQVPVIRCDALFDAMHVTVTFKDPGRKALRTVVDPEFYPEVNGSVVCGESDEVGVNLGANEVRAIVDPFAGRTTNTAVFSVAATPGSATA